MVLRGPLSHLDQGQQDDPRASTYSPTAEKYFEYLLRDYDKNLRLLPDSWRSHYDFMNETFTDFMLGYVERHIPRHEINFGILGPGLAPAGRDYTEAIVRTVLDRCNAVIPIDFSPQVNRAAVQNLIEAGVAPGRLFPVQLDITGGISSMYHQYWQEMCRTGETEDDYSKIAERMAGMDVVGGLWDRMAEFYKQMEKAKDPADISHDVRSKFGNLFSPKHSLRFTSAGEQVPLDIITSNMVMAGTGSATEAEFFWEPYQDAMQTSDKGHSPDEARIAQRKQTIINVTRVICQYNTEIGRLMLKALLTAHPTARVLAITDYSTIYLSPSVNGGLDPENAVGEVPRIDFNRMCAELAAEDNIEVQLGQPTAPWKWWDQLPFHGHMVTSMKAQKSKKPNGHLPSPTA